MSFKEKRAHGTPDFPVQLYSTDRHHPRYEMSCHWHSEYELIYINKGVINLTLNDRRYAASEGDLVIINAGVLHSGLPQGDGCVYDCVVFNMHYLAAQNDVCGTFIKNVINCDVLIDEYFPRCDDRIHLLAENVIDELKNCADGYQLNVKGLLYLIIGIVCREKYYKRNDEGLNRSEQKITRLKDVIELIEESFDSDISLEMMAEKARLTPKYFCAYFKEITNKSPMEYLIGYRVEQACVLLENTNMSVTEIAFSCGFNDLSYFIRTFRKLKETTPNKFRKKISG
jgi:AraC-type DNA-binding domain-containing proteins